MVQIVPMDIKEKHERLLKKKRELTPYLSINLIAETITNGSVSTAQKDLEEMVKLGLVKKIPFGRGNKSHYDIMETP